MTEIMILSVLIPAAFIARSLVLYGILFVVIMVTGFGYNKPPVTVNRPLPVNCWM